MSCRALSRAAVERLAGQHRGALCPEHQLCAARAGRGRRRSERAELAAAQKILLARQNQDGGWGLDRGASDALATGQTLYALRLAGHGDGETAIDRGTAWLVQHQQPGGAWRTYTSNQGGAENGETMWAVLGLVAMGAYKIRVTRQGFAAKEAAVEAAPAAPASKADIQLK